MAHKTEQKGLLQIKGLWLINILMPEQSAYIDSKPIVIGGWVQSLLPEVSKNIHLTICSISDLVCEPVSFEKYGIKYFIYPPSFLLEEEFKKLLSCEKYKFVHVFGTELPHSLAMAKAAKSIGFSNVLIHIQGVMAASALHYVDALPLAVKRFKPLKEFYNLLTKSGKTISGEVREFSKKAVREQETLSIVSYVSGRTEWDRKWMMQLAPWAQYFTCGENLRPSFEQEEPWSFDACQAHRIFISSAEYPLKGFHVFLNAIPFILTKHPDTQVYLSGNLDGFGASYRHSAAIKDRLFTLLHDWSHEYSGYLHHLIKRNQLEKHIHPLGYLNENQMIEQNKIANVFVCCSALENSPNSLGEAMMLGVPCVASNVGGIPSMLEHKKEGLLYSFDSSEALARSVIEIFEKPDSAAALGKSARERAKIQHNSKTNTQITLNIYKEILAHGESL